QQWIGNRTNSEVVVALAEAGIPAGELLTPAQVLENEQVVEGGFFQHLDVANAEVSAPIANHPLIYSKTPVQPFKAAPKLGQHTNEILAELGFDQAKIEALRSSRIV
ncbi:MAG: crotonobetainyl-CoA:carnitine CoA-transferase CaiB-like acyl-CoA transferase, partial [Arenicella sp.]